MSFDDSEQIGEGRDIRFLAIQNPHITPYFELVAATIGQQIKLYSFTLYNIGGSPIVARLMSSTVSITGDICIQPTAPWQEFSMPSNPLLQTDTGKNLAIFIGATAPMGGHISYYYEQLAPV